MDHLQVFRVKLVYDELTNPFEPYTPQTSTHDLTMSRPISQARCEFPGDGMNLVIAAVH